MTEQGLELKSHPRGGWKIFRAEKEAEGREQTPGPVPRTTLRTCEGPRRPRVWGHAHPAPGPAPSWSGKALARDRPDRDSRGYSPALPGARAPVTSATPAVARRSSSAPRGEARTLAMSGPGGSEAAGCSDPA